jgi:putative membrane protein
MSDPWETQGLRHQRRVSAELDAGIHPVSEVRMGRLTVAAIAALTTITLSASSIRTAEQPSPGASALDDPTIVAIFDAANTADIETGMLAAERASSKEVRDFGSMLARDHKQVRQQGRDLAAKLGVTPTPPKDDQGAKDHELKTLVVQVAPAFEAHMIAAQNLEKKLAGR